MPVQDGQGWAKEGTAYGLTVKINGLLVGHICTEGHSAVTAGSIGAKGKKETKRAHTCPMTATCRTAAKTIDMPVGTTGQETHADGKAVRRAPKEVYTGSDEKRHGTFKEKSGLSV